MSWAEVIMKEARAQVAARSKSATHKVSTLALYSGRKQVRRAPKKVAASVGAAIPVPVVGSLLNAAVETALAKVGEARRAKKQAEYTEAARVENLESLRKSAKVGAKVVKDVADKIDTNMPKLRDAACSSRAFRRARPEERVTLLTGAAVDAARLQRELPAGHGRAGYRYLHLATHGFFEPPPENTVTRRPPLDQLAAEYRTFVRNPMLLSGLVLAGANRDPARAVLTAEEVAGLDLRGAELVVLSACDTGLGKVASGEGVLGLQRGFHEAGARALAASLWSVSDAATSVLMEEFYHNLWHKRLTRLEALRQAQLAVLRDPGRVEARAEQLQRELAKEGPVVALRGGSKKAVSLPAGGRIDERPRRSHPAYWAAFVLSGDTGPLPPAAQASDTSGPRPDQ
jgi:CHAT domain-containing protein